MYTLFILDHEYLASNLLSVSQDLSKRIQLCKYAFCTPILYCRNRMNKMELRKNEMASLTFISSNSYFEDALGVVCRLRYNIFVAHIIRLQIYVSFYLISDTVIRSIFNILWIVQVFIWFRVARYIGKYKSINMIQFLIKKNLSIHSLLDRYVSQTFTK